MIAKEELKKMIQKELDAKLAGKALTPQPTIEQPSPPQPPQPIVKPLDEIDGIRLENLVLKQELEKKQKEIEDMRRANVAKALQEAQMDLQNFIVNKYEIDASKNTLTINGAALTLTITPRE